MINQLILKAGNFRKIRSLVWGFSLISGVAAFGNEPLILDMVHHNPGEDLYDSAYNDPAVLKKMGYNGKVYFLFESPMLAINWESVDPDILPKGSDERQWVEAKAAQIKKMQAESHAAGLQVYAQSDVMLFPKRLIKKYGIEKTFGDLREPIVKKLLRAQINEMFDQFPGLDGLVVRIGETYLHGAPYHKGRISEKSNTQMTIIPLMKILREEVCVKRDKKLIFRTWMAFDGTTKKYQEVSDGVEPHPNLAISIKQCDDDFHRANPFNKVIGQGRHQQIIEVQCAREYEGKGAYPNYVANGVIEGFEEHAEMPKEKIKSLRELTEKKPKLFAGVWTWSRGGGWHGPYIKNEMWCDLNAWVMAQWAKDSTQSEEKIFYRYATEQLKLGDEDAAKFRKLCLLSADAVIRGRNSTHRDMHPMWTRDQGIGWPKVEKDQSRRARNLVQKDESIALWKEIVSLAESIQWADAPTREHAIGSAYYGLRLFEIYRSIVYLSEAESKNDQKGIKHWITAYDKAWAAYNKLPEKHPSIATLYTQDYKSHIRDHAHTKINKLRAQVKAP